MHRANGAMNRRMRSHLPKSLMMRVGIYKFATSAGRLGELGPTIAQMIQGQYMNSKARVESIMSLAAQGDQSRLETITLNSSSSSSSSTPSSQTATLSNPPSSQASTSTSSSTSSSTSTSSTPSTSTRSSSTSSSSSTSTQPSSESLQEMDVDTASLYSILGGSGIISCHALLYQQFANIVRPSQPFADMFRNMNQ